MRLPPKKTLRRDAVPGTARFLTFSCYRHLRLFDNDRIKQHFVDILTPALSLHQTRAITWVVMPEHVHLITYADDPTTLPAFLRTLKRPFARTVLDRWRTLGAPILPRLRDVHGHTHFWQTGGGYDRCVVDAELIEKIRYVHANLVTRSLAPPSMSYPWSSAAAYLQMPKAIGPPIAFDLIHSHHGELT